MGTAHLTTSTTTVIPPVKIFDNMAVIRTEGTNCIVIESDEGPILLISYGHPDRSGCSRHFVEKYGAVPYMSRVDHLFEQEFCIAQRTLW